MSRKPYPWPLKEMLGWYKQGWSCQEIADWLGGKAWDAYWKQHLGQPYRPSQKIVNKVMKRHLGDAMRPTGARGNRNGNWNGGTRKDGEYVLVLCPSHPYARVSGYVCEHRLVMEEMLGRLLEPDEVVHHIDDDPSNNEPENLMLFQNNAVHISTTMKGKVPSSRIAKAREARWQGHVPQTKRRKRKASGGFR